jgi:hypothetical protein
VKVVGDGERHLSCACVAKAGVARERHDPVVLGSQECAALDPVGIEDRLDKAFVDPRIAVETEVETPVGKPTEEREESVRVRCLRRAQPHRRAIAKNDV